MNTRALWIGQDLTLIAAVRTSGSSAPFPLSLTYILDTPDSDTSNIQRKHFLFNFLAPVLRVMKRLYSSYRYTAISVLELDFDRIDINQCPPGEGNSGPNRFADTARCKKETTEVSSATTKYLFRKYWFNSKSGLFYVQCEPIHGWGFRRGGYQCRCRPGYRLPSVVRRPYLGEIVERATSEQYYNNFECSKIGCKFTSKPYCRLFFAMYLTSKISSLPHSWLWPSS